MPRRTRDLGVLLFIPLSFRGTVLEGQGLVRHALTVVAAIVTTTQTPVTVVTPKWARPQVTAALFEAGRSSDWRVRVVSPMLGAPAEFVEWTLRRIQAMTSARRGTSRGASGAGRLRLIAWAFTSWGRLLLATIVTVSVLFGLIIAVAALLNAVARVLGPWPFVVLAGIAALLLVLAVALLAVIVARALASVRQTYPGPNTSIPRRLVAAARATLGPIRRTITLQLERASVAHLVRSANRTGIRHWWIPIGFYAGAASLRGTRVTTFADFVPAEFPRMLAEGPVFAARGREMAGLLSASDGIICLSSHVAERHLPYLLPDPPGKVHVIPPGPPLRTSVPEAAPDSERLAARIREAFPGSRAGAADWWADPVIVLPTQVRPYKNIETFMSAVGMLNRQRYRRVRVILTGQTNGTDLRERIHEAGNGAFIEYLPNLPDDLLDAILATADLAASPSLFEGSLPFTLFEAVSLGTPCLLADIPVTRAAAAQAPGLLDRSLFPPTSPTAIADAISDALDDPVSILEAQHQFLNAYYSRHSWQECARQYLVAAALLDEGGSSR